MWVELIMEHVVWIINKINKFIFMLNEKLEFLNNKRLTISINFRY